MPILPTRTRTEVERQKEHVAFDIGTSTLPFPFKWDHRHWKDRRYISKIVRVMVNKTNSSQLVVHKLLELGRNSSDPTPIEVRALAGLPNCNRIVKPLYYGPDADLVHAAAIYPYYPFGDLAEWRHREFDERNFKKVPESFIWRFFLQMTQALAVIQGDIGPKRADGTLVIHRDIKPKNILVVNNGSTYPSFRLHDFGCARIYSTYRRFDESLCGTFEWQPPENPQINTFEADIWSLGACVHYLATGEPPIMSRQRFQEYQLTNKNPSPFLVNFYGSTGRYCAARAPRIISSINIDVEEQRRQDTLNGVCPRRYPNLQYSDELDSWMKVCLNPDRGLRPTAKQLLESMESVARNMLRKMGGQAALVDMDAKWSPAN